MCTFTHEQQLQIPMSIWRHRAPHTSVLQTRSTPATQPISPPVPQNTTDDSRLQATTKICCSKGSICSYQCPTVTRVTRHLSYSPWRAPAAVPAPNHGNDVHNELYKKCATAPSQTLHVQSSKRRVQMSTSFETARQHINNEKAVRHNRTKISIP